MNELAIAVGSAVAVAAILFAANRARAYWDRRRVVAWLSANTTDAPGESHVETVVIAKGIGVPEDRIRLACLADVRIMRESGKSDSWSIWRESPQSVYEVRGIRHLGE